MKRIQGGLETNLKTDFLKSCEKVTLVPSYQVNH